MASNVRVNTGRGGDSSNHAGAREEIPAGHRRRPTFRTKDQKTVEVCQALVEKSQLLRDMIADLDGMEMDLQPVEVQFSEAAIRLVGSVVFCVSVELLTSGDS